MGKLQPPRQPQHDCCPHVARAPQAATRRVAVQATQQTNAGARDQPQVATGIAVTASTRRSSQERTATRFHLLWLVLLLATAIFAVFLRSLSTQPPLLPEVPPSSPHSSWSCAEVARWLRAHGMDAVAQRIAEEEVDGSMLAELTEEELQSLTQDELERQRWKALLDALIREESQASGSAHPDPASPVSAPPPPPPPPVRPSYAALSSLSPSSLSHLRRLAERYPLQADQGSLRPSRTSASADGHPMGDGADGCSRQLSRLFGRTPERRRPTVQRRQLVVIVGDDGAIAEFMGREYAFLDLLLVNRPSTPTLQSLPSSTSASAASSLPPLHAQVTLEQLQLLPCLLAEIGVQPHVIFVNAPRDESLMRLTNVWPDGSSTDPGDEHRCDRWWSSNLFSAPPVLMGMSPPTDTHEGYLSHLAAQLGRRIYVDQPCFTVAQSERGIGCNDALPDSIESPEEVTPLLALYMIVKNEAASIAETLDSALPFVQRVTILDTGSTDGTPGLIERKLSEYAPHGVEGAVVSGPFEDFSQARNLALSHAARMHPSAVFVLMLNGDDELRGGEALVRFLRGRRHLCGPSEEMYLLSVDYDGHKITWSERLIRMSVLRLHRWPDERSHWHYDGLTHEVWHNAPYAARGVAMSYVGRRHSQSDVTIGGPTPFGIFHSYRFDTPAHTRRRSELDVQLLRRQLQSQPGHMRATFYLARSLDQLGRHREAFSLFRQRVEGLLERGRRARHPSEGVALSTSASAERTIPPASPVSANGDECYALLRMLKLSTVLYDDDAFASLPRADRPGVARQDVVPLFRQAMAVCPRACEIPFYLALYYAQQLDELQLARIFLAHARRLCAAVPPFMETAVASKRIGELEQALGKRKRG